MTDSGATDFEAFTQGNTRVVVTQPAGFFLKVQVLARVDLPPSAVYNILTDPHNDRIFRNVKGTTYRRVLRDDGRRQVVEQERLTGWRFLMFRGTFSTRLLVEQDSKTRTIKFKLAKRGMMKDFEGTWQIEPFSQGNYNKALQRSAAAGTDGTAGDQVARPMLRLALPSFALTDIGARKDSTIVSLSQSVAPSYVPPVLQNVLRGISVRTVRTVLEDLQAEAERIKSSDAQKGRTSAIYQTAESLLNPRK